ncbi:MAG: DUF1343 domain-containing protein [Chitinophagales bacterium]|nr:DUF1343 domain-containing protein [Chitinophagales bacterium]
MKILFLIVCALLLRGGNDDFLQEQENKVQVSNKLTVGAARFDLYLPTLRDKRVGLVVNHTSLVGDAGQERHLLDTLLAQGIKVVKVFAPEHGFRGTADAGEEVKSGKDKATGVSIVSLYGANRKPTAEQMKDVDVVVFDIQDVGARFYTYISTMHYVMEACAEQNKLLVVLDRPNPNGFYVDGPVLKPEFKSFVGMHPGVPIVHGMTVGEYAQMINGEAWLPNKSKCPLTIVPCVNYDHEMLYTLPVKPSPNLPNMTSVYLYPSLCLFEGTIMSVGRGTEFPFQVYGSPSFPSKRFSFTPKSLAGAKTPPYRDTLCYGVDLRQVQREEFLVSRKLNLQYVMTAYHKTPENLQKTFFIKYFDQLAGTDELKKQIQQGKTEQEIRYSWENGLAEFKQTRKKYLLYPDNL